LAVKEIDPIWFLLGPISQDRFKRNLLLRSFLFSPFDPRISSGPSYSNPTPCGPLYARRTPAFKHNILWPLAGILNEFLIFREGVL